MTQAPDEKTYVEISFVEQFEEMGWEHMKRLKAADCGRNWDKLTSGFMVNNRLTEYLLSSGYFFL